MNTIRYIPPGRSPHRRSGAALIVGMILLLLLTAVGLTSLKAIRTDERMAGNLQDRYLAFQAAESALREGEDLLNDPALPALQPSEGFYRFDQQGIPRPYDFAAGNARQYTRRLDVVDLQPLYIIEQMEGGVEQGTSLVIGVAPYGGLWRACYRITAIGFGRSATTRVVLQATYRR